MKLILVLAVGTASLLFSVSLTKRAHAFDMRISVGTTQDETLVKLAKKEEEQIIREEEQAVVEERVSQVEPAAG